MVKSLLLTALVGMNIPTNATICDGFKKIEDCQVILSCKEAGQLSVFMETEVWLKGDQMTLVKFLNHEGGKRTKMTDYDVTFLDKGKSVVLKNIENNYLEIIKDNHATVFNENVMNKNYKTNMTCKL
jgi:hypothetical protein